MILRRTLLVSTALVMLAGTAALGRDVGDFSQWTWLAMTLSVAGGVLVLATAWLWHEQTVPRSLLFMVALLAIFMRLLIMPATRELSDDAARYHWDGKANAHGVNPFMHSPNDPLVARLWTDPVDDRINHPWNITCYPPVAQGIFTVGYKLSPGNLQGLQWLSLLAEILTWIVLARELKRRHQSVNWLLLMVWSPLLVCQGYLPGHLDMFTLPFVALLISAVLAGKGGRSGLWLAMACLVKPLPLMFLPAIALELGWRRTVRLLAVFILVSVVSYIPFRQAGWLLFSSTWLMATDWSFNGSVGAIFESIFPMGRAHLLSGILTGLGILLVAWRGRDFLARVLAAQMVFIIFTPTLFPWYLISAMPLLVLRPQPALLALVVLVPLADLVVINHQLQDLWSETTWVRWVQYLPFYGIVLWAGISNRIRHRRHLIPND